MRVSQNNTKKKKKLSNEKLPYLQWELRSFEGVAEALLKDYPMSWPRNSLTKKARLEALDCLLVNITNGQDLIIPNFSRIRTEEHGFSRAVFLDTLNHLQKVALIGREGDGYARSIITYAARIRRYIPTRIIYKPLSFVVVNEKEGGTVVPKVDSEERRNLKKRLSRICDFYLQHQISTGIDKETFDVFNQLEVEVRGKQPLIFPDQSKIFPYIVYNDRDLTKGGRMYGAFWIGEKKILRRAITIDGELTSDIDGKGMHVQLLYRQAKVKMPPGDPYIFADQSRATAKKLMLLMMNTSTPMPPHEGRTAVARTFRKHFGATDGIDDLILELEAYHHQIADQFYKPNWGNLQKTEAAILLSIMKSGVDDDIVILPVHDGCLCQRMHADKVLGYFEAHEIVATENLSHRKRLPLEEAIQALAAYRRFDLVA